jgi:glycosyltransferase involved in cell wall biosynthesis
MPVIIASPAYPRPPIDGDKVRWSALLQEMARREPLRGVFGFMPRMEARDPAFDALFTSVAVIDTPNYEVSARAAWLELRGRPSAFGRRATPRWCRAVLAATVAEPASPALLLGTSGGYVPAMARPTFLDLVDVQSRVRTLGGDRLLRRGTLDAELALARRHALVLACDADRRWLVDHGAHPDRIHVIPHGVDPRFTPGSAQTARRAVFVGNLRYRPNRDALDWFLRTIWPGLRASGVTLRIVGYGADRLHAAPDIEVVADAPDVLPHYQAAAVSIAPLREARGTQLKVLESMAAGVPVVCTSPVARGLFDDHPALVADDPPAFIAACATILDNASVRRDLAVQGRAYIERHHQWSASARLFEQVLNPGPDVTRP